MKSKYGNCPGTGGNCYESVTKPVTYPPFRNNSVTYIVPSLLRNCYKNLIKT